MQAISRRQFLRGVAGIGATALIAACAPVGAPASGGGAAAPSKAKVTLRWDVSDATDVPAMLDMGKKAAALFAQKHPEIEIIPEPPPEDQAQMILTQMIAGKAPDIPGMCCATLPFWAQKGQLVDLTPFVDKDLTKEQIADYPKPHWDAFANPHSGRFAMPMYMGTIVLFYNKDMFDAKGVKYPDATWNWTLDGNGKFEDALRKLSDPDKKVWGGSVGDGPDRLQQKIAGNGGHWVDPKDDMKAAFDQPAALDALQWEWDRLWKEKTLIQFAARENQGAEIIMGNGRLAMYESGDWQLSPMVKTATGKYKWDVAEIPQGPVQKNTLITTDGWPIWKGTKAVNEAWEFVKWLQSDEWNDLMMSIGYLRPSRLSLFSKWKSIVSKAVPELADKNLDAFNEAAKNGTTLELFQFNAEATEIIVAARDKAIRTGDPNVKDTFTQAAAKVNEAEQKASKSAGILRPNCECKA
ncbi:MAG: substrate-binding domain-containing protein [Caldilineaceae bacterium]